MPRRSKDPRRKVKYPGFAARLRAARGRLGLTQIQVAQKMGWTDRSKQTRLSNYETGIRFPKPRDLELLSKVLEESPGHLGYGEERLSRAVGVGAIGPQVAEAVAAMGLSEDAQLRVARVLEHILSMPPIFQQYAARKIEDIRAVTDRLPPLVRKHMLGRLPEGSDYLEWERMMLEQFQMLSGKPAPEPPVAEPPQPRKSR